MNQAEAMLSMLAVYLRNFACLAFEAHLVLFSSPHFRRAAREKATSGHASVISA